MSRGKDLFGWGKVLEWWNLSREWELLARQYQEESPSCGVAEGQLCLKAALLH